MSSAKGTSWYRELTVEQARALRVDQARLAALYAERAERAQASGQRTAMEWWITEYRRSALSCRRLGERIRREHQVLHAVGLKPPRSIPRRAIRSASAAPRSGKAA